MNNPKHVIQTNIGITDKVISPVNSLKLYVAFRDRGFSNPYYNSFLGFIAYAPLALSLILLVTFLTSDTKKDFNVILILAFCSIISAFFSFRKFFIYLMNYPNFKNWQKRLSFGIVGYENLLSKPELTNWLFWYEHCSIKIKYSQHCSAQTKKSVALASIAFIKNAEDVVFQFNIYDHWKFENDTLTGYANNTVVGFTQRFISQDLDSIHKQYGGIDSVEILVSKKMIQIINRESEYN